MHKLLLVRIFMKRYLLPKEGKELMDKVGTAFLLQALGDYVYASKRPVSTDVVSVVSIILHHTNRDKQSCYMSAERLMKLLGLTRMRTFRALKEADKLDLVIKKRQGQGKPNVYYPGNALMKYAQKYIKPYEKGLKHDFREFQDAANKYTEQNDTERIM